MDFFNKSEQAILLAAKILLLVIVVVLIQLLRSLQPMNS